jgi:preprotein translocase subunit SecD
MNRYPLWKNLLVVGLIFLALLYTIPNFYGEVPAVQVSTNKNTLKIDTLISSKIETALSEAGLAAQSIHLEANQGGGTLRAKFKDTDTQIRAKDLIEKTLNPDSKNAQYIVALSLVPGSPNWLTSIHALPMYLGLDLRGGVHFLLQVDLEGAISKRLDRLSADIRLNLKSQQIRHGGVNKTGSQNRS